MATGARTPKEDVVSEEVRVLMVEGKEAGLTFEEAWARMERRIIFPADWRNSPEGWGESVLEFTYRAHLAAWHRAELGRPCAEEGCDELVNAGDRWCLLHIPELELLPSPHERQATAA